MKVSGNVRTNTKFLVLTAMFIAIGIVLPIAFHSIPNAGKIMLPMHIPVLLCGFICGPIYGMLAGVLTPILSSAMTQMPPMYPMAVIMLVELAVYGFTSGIMIRVIKTKWSLVNIYISLVIALVLGRVVSAPMSCAMFNMPFNAWVSGSLAVAVPGLVVQLTVIPALLYALQRAKLIDMNSNGVWGIATKKNNKKIKEFFNEKAPTWDSRQEETDERISELLNYVKINEGDKVLDIACGTGIIDRELVKRGAKVTAIDLSDKMIEIAKQKNADLGVDYKVQDFYDYDESGFDTAIIFNAYPHFTEKEELVKALSRTLKKGGRFVVMHSMGYEKLNEHHKNIQKGISLELKPASEEVKNFEGKFDVDFIVDQKDIYIFSGISK